ncbi:alpha/beta fold hydrolase [Pseudonocardia parietis]|uniref:Pimeloyl-ACP methyl ester carboxylesterase n=1 Tax=Pseudonocardia parietis TaxID=570936 RepID=A0ABS4VUT6_9PSEU|nr:alpha/beta hydrolase [Pseudonocardia parietis]MBP2367571.1 pimeloyl-ACP methyl ester carboxylesterase [Pseudonocardia parietis]
MDTYRSEPGQRILQQWCRAELDRALPSADRRVAATSLGPTHLVTVGTGPQVLLLPGTNFGAATSLPLISMLAASFRVTTVDLPGQPGLSAGTRVDDDVVSRHRRWLTEVLAAIGDAPVLIVGESLGAAVALCAEPGPSIGGLALVVPAGLVSARVDAGILAASVPWLLRSTPARAEHLLATMDGGARVADRDRLVEWMAMVPRHARSSLAPSPLPNQVLTGWRDTPCRVVAGEHDRFFPPERLTVPARNLLHAGTTVVAGAGHLLAHTAPEAVVEVVADLHRSADDTP